MNKYDILGVIDEGAYGTVLKASLKDTDKLVAIKKFKETDEDPEVRGPIQREIRMLKALRSDFVVDLKEAFRKYKSSYRRKGKVYLVFQFMEKNLLQLIEQHPIGLPPDIVQRLTYQIVQCIHFLHTKEVVHRDLKPQNLLLSSKLFLKLCDFGFTRTITDSDDNLTDYVATRWYRSPELLVGDHYGKPLDIWSIGCIVYEMITGEPLFPGENEIDQLHLIRKSLGQLSIQQNNKIKENFRFIGVKFPELRKLDTIEAKLKNKASRNLVQFIKDCLILDPNKRLTSFQALQHPYFANSLSNNLKLESPTDRRQCTAPLVKKGGSLTDKNIYRIKTIYNSKSNENMHKFAGATRPDPKKYGEMDKNKIEAMPQLQLTITQLNVNNNYSPDSIQSPAKNTLKSFVKAKMSLNSHQNEYFERKTKNTFRLSHFKMRSLVNIYNRSQGLRPVRFDNNQINFTVAGQTKSITKKA